MKQDARIAEQEAENRELLIDYENRLCEARKYQQDAVRRCEEMEAECDRLRKALEEIAQWDMLARSQKGLIAIIEVLKDTARKALKGAGE